MVLPNCQVGSAVPASVSVGWNRRSGANSTLIANPESLRPQATAELRSALDGRGRPSPHGVHGNLQFWPEVACGAAGSWNVALERVIHHHAIGIEAPAKGADGALHALDPAAWKAVAIALIVERDHF